MISETISSSMSLGISNKTLLLDGKPHLKMKLL